MQEECRQWDVNEIVFSPAMWGSYHHLMRSDFTLFDEYKFTAAGGWACAWMGGGMGGCMERVCGRVGMVGDGSEEGGSCSRREQALVSACGWLRIWLGGWDGMHGI